MYAVIRAGGKQYRVAPGDVLRLETQAGGKDGKVEFGDVLAVSANAGEIVRPESGAVVTGHIVGDARLLHAAPQAIRRRLAPPSITIV